MQFEYWAPAMNIIWPANPKDIAAEDDDFPEHAFVSAFTFELALALAIK